MRWQRCSRHNGLHLSVWGQCVHEGAQAAFKPAACGDCGDEVMRRMDLATGRVTTVDAGSDELHRHIAPIRVELDQDALATAIVSASRATRQERRPETSEIHPRSPLAYPPSRPAAPPDDFGTIFGVPVVKPDDGPA